MNDGDGGAPGRWLRRRREDAGLLQEELADRSGVSVRTVSGLERGSTRGGPAEPGSVLDYFEADWQTAFRGDYYARLMQVKDRYDPGGLFFVHHGVGTET
jgi:transcriptional regulator with XRE-family HTH domain